MSNNSELNPSEKSSFSHIDDKGQANMVDVGEKAQSTRTARAQAKVRMSAQCLQLIKDGSHHKGDVFATARIAGIMAAKKTSDLIPLCHPLMLSKVSVDIEIVDDLVVVSSFCKLTGQTGVEMEALTAASVAALTIYDMCKAVQKDIVIESLALLEKTGGKSGDFHIDHGA